MPFIAGPAVRVIPNYKVEVRWGVDFVGDGKVALFDNPDGGVPIAVKTTPTSGTDHAIEFPVSDTGVVKPDTTFYFQVTHEDTAGISAPLTNEPPLPPVFTGAQVIGDVFADAGSDSAVISWTANVIGFGRVEYGLVSPGDLGTLQDPFNITDHSIELTGLSPGTTYQIRVSNRHAIDQGSLAEKTGTFTTPPAVSGVSLTRPLARPRVIGPGQLTLLSVVVRKQESLIPDVPVRFAVLGGSAHSEAVSDGEGRAAVWMQGIAGGLLRVEASSPVAVNRLIIPVVVRRR